MIQFTENERPIGVQIFGEDPETVSKSALFIKKLCNPDIIDINYGCPVKKVVSKGAGAGILKDIKKMVLMTKLIVQESKVPRRKEEACLVLGLYP